MTKYPTNDLSLTRDTYPFPIIISMRTRHHALVPPHHHQFYEISFYIEGHALDFVSGRRVTASRGTIVCKSPHRIHETRVVKGFHYIKFNLMFDLDILFESNLEVDLKHFFYFSQDNETQMFLQLDEQQTIRMERLFREIHHDYEANGLFRQLYIRAKLIEILVQIARSQDQAHAMDTNMHSRDLPKINRSESKATQIVIYINSHFLLELSLGHLSEKFVVSTPYISKMIKKITGMNFVDYVNELRIQQACSLLVCTQMNILEISEESGYNSFKTFSRAFLKKKGMPPSKYRMQQQLQGK